MTALGRAIANGLDRAGEGDSGADDLDKGGAAAGEMVGEHLAGAAEVTAGGSRAGALLDNLGGDAKLQACVAGSLGRADTTLVLLGDHVEHRPCAPESPTGVTFGVVASNDGPTAGVHATKGELITGTPGILAGDWGRTGACGATVT